MKECKIKIKRRLGLWILDTSRVFVVIDVDGGELCLLVLEKDIVDGCIILPVKSELSDRVVVITPSCDSDLGTPIEGTSRETSVSKSLLQSVEEQELRPL